MRLSPSLTQWVPASLPTMVRLPSRKVYQSLPSTAEVNNVRNYSSLFSYIFMTWCLIKRGQIHLPLYQAKLSLQPKLVGIVSLLSPPKKVPAVYST